MESEQREAERAVEPLVEGWPSLMFLGLGAWWAWVWLCYTSSELSRFFTYAEHNQYIVIMYLVSTVSIALCMLATAVFWKKLSPLFDRRGPTIAGGALAAVATLLIGISGITDNDALFYIAAFASGIGTSALSIKVGRVYGSTNLSEALFSGALSLVFAVLLYFVCTGLPIEMRLVAISLLPLVSALLLVIPVNDPFPSLIHSSNEELPFDAPERKVYHRLIAALGMVSFTAGVGKSISGLSGSIASYAQDSAIMIISIGIAALFVCWWVNHMKGARRIYRVYTFFMVFGIFMMFITGFGVPIIYLGVGEEVLHLIFICIAAYIVFKFDFSSIRSFAIVQGAYFVSSTIGWAVGAALVPFYSDGMTRMAVGMILAFMVVVVLIFVLPEAQLKQVGEWEYKNVAGASSSTAILSGVVLDARANEMARIDAPGRTTVPEEVKVDDLSRARDPRYGLSARELEILELFAQGRSANWIADHFVISKNTVRSHLRNIYTKLDVHTRQGLLDFLAGAPSSLDD